MQYTQQQRLAPEAPYESTLYSPTLSRRSKQPTRMNLSNKKLQKTAIKLTAHPKAAYIQMIH